MSLSRQALDARDPADGRDRRAAVGDPEVGQALAGGEHVVEVHHRLAHAHEDAVVDGRSVRRKCSAWSRISEAVRLRPKRIAPGGAEACRSAGSPTARTGRASAARRGSASAPPPPAARRRWRTAPSRCRRAACASRSSASVENGHRFGQRGRAARAGSVVISLVARAPARGPLPHLAGAEGGLAGGGQRRVEERRGPRGKGSRGNVAASTSPMRLAKYLAHAGVASRRAAEQIIARAG